ncbi:MAG TPA: NUDIX hydrolase [Candidatus Acetothermia bacterium]|nr:NUDIX hydrolase [Candidatus Acetothermia bacterium]
MPRVVTEAIILQQGKVLLVKGSRGFTEGRWTLPGGFVRFGESPEEGLRRELKEELGVQVSELLLVSIRSKIGARSRLHWTMFFYRATISGPIRPHADEISAFCFLPPEDAVSRLDDPTMQDVLHTLASPRC